MKNRQAAKEMLIALFVQIIEDDPDNVLDSLAEDEQYQLLEALAVAQYRNAEALISRRLVDDGGDD